MKRIYNIYETFGAPIIQKVKDFIAAGYRDMRYMFRSKIDWYNLKDYYTEPIRPIRNHSDLERVLYDHDITKVNPDYQEVVGYTRKFAVLFAVFTDSKDRIISVALYRNNRFTFETLVNHKVVESDYIDVGDLSGEEVAAIGGASNVTYVYLSANSVKELVNTIDARAELKERAHMNIVNKEILNLNKSISKAYKDVQDVISDMPENIHPIAKQDIEKILQTFGKCLKLLTFIRTSHKEFSPKIYDINKQMFIDDDGITISIYDSINELVRCAQTILTADHTERGGSQLSYNNDEFSSADLSYIELQIDYIFSEII